jgi:hypothetical protein
MQIAERSSINGRSGWSNRDLLFGVGVDRFLLVGARESIKTGSNCSAKTKEANWRQLFITAGSELTSERAPSSEGRFCASLAS